MATVLRPPLATSIGRPDSTVAVNAQDWVRSATPLLGGGAQPFAQSDWPNPISPDRWHQARTGVVASNLPLLTFVAVGPSPFAQLDWPNPRGPLRAVDLLTGIDTYKRGLFVEAIPSLNFDWPVPPGPRQGAVTNRTHAEGYKLGLFVERIPSLNFDWPVPRGPVPAIELRTAINTYRLGLFIEGIPFLNMDWPVPRGPEWNRDLRTWLAGNNMPNLIFVPPVIVAPYLFAQSVM